MKPKQYRINEARVFGFHVIEVRTELNWEPISRPMDKESAQSALEQLNRRHEPAIILESNDVPEQGELSRVYPSGQVVC